MPLRPLQGFHTDSQAARTRGRSIKRGYSSMMIDRFNRQFAVTLGANNAPDFPLDAAVRAIGAEIRKAGLPTGYSLQFTGSAKRSAIAVTIIGGQMLCLLPTLLITPVAYSLFAGLAERRLFQAAKAKLARLRISLARVFTMLIH